MSNPKRYFTLGSKWIYYKLYMGSKTSEQFLISKIKPLADQLLNDNVIDKWFFINYNDPDRHIRIRFHMIDVERDLYPIIQYINRTMEPLIKERLLSEIVVGTYKRELERYGKNTIDHFESLFFYNSELIVNILKNCEDQPEKRWLWGMKAIDFILNDWGANLISKRNLFESLKNSFGNEMGVNSSINKQLSAKFRTYRPKIVSLIENGEEELMPLLLDHQTKFKSVIEKIRKKNKDDKSLTEDTMYSALNGYIHMHYNRLFSSRQRMNEWVVYYLLHQYYRSKVAQENNKNLQR